MLACNSPKIIPDKVLANIFHDAMLVNAYLQQNPHMKKDSLNFYEPIFAKYGYTTEDVHYTVNNFARRKSASLGNVTDRMAEVLRQQSDALHELVTKQDTIDNVAERRSTILLLHDTAIVAKTEADTALLQIAVRHARKGNYKITGYYTLDADDKGIGRRYGVSWRCGDSLLRSINSFPMLRGRRGSINIDVWLGENDTLADQLYIDFTRFNMRKHRLKKTPLTIHELKVTYSEHKDDALQRLFNQQSMMRIFADTMLNFRVDTLASAEIDTLTTTNAE